MKQTYHIHQKEVTDVLVGKGALNKIASVLKRYHHTSYLLLCDRTANQLFGKIVLQKLEKLGIPLSLYELPPGEENKSIEKLTEVLKHMLSLKMDRKSAVIAMGGGVIGDLATVLAGLYKRGIDCIQIPTTLLSQVDSAFGGKGAVNTTGYKNIIGLIKQPRAILVDYSLLDTLPEKQINSGMGEVIKYALALDSKLYEKLSSSSGHISLSEIAKRCSMLKMKMVETDPTDISKKRAVLNFGHTFGHAVELLAHIPHGEAVSIGMFFAIRLSEDLKLLSKEDAQKAISLLQKYNLPTSISGIDKKEVLKCMQSDKKAIQGIPYFILLKGIGKATPPIKVPVDILFRVLQKVII